MTPLSAVSHEVKFAKDHGKKFRSELAPAYNSILYTKTLKRKSLQSDWLLSRELSYSSVDFPRNIVIFNCNIQM